MRDGKAGGRHGVHAIVVTSNRHVDRLWPATTPRRTPRRTLRRTLRPSLSLSVGSRYEAVALVTRVHWRRRDRPRRERLGLGLVLVLGSGRIRLGLIRLIRHHSAETGDFSDEELFQLVLLPNHLLGRGRRVRGGVREGREWLGGMY